MLIRLKSSIVLNPPHIMSHLLPLFFLQSQITSISFCHIAFYALLCLSTYQTVLRYQFTFHSYNQQFFINRDYFGNEGYTTVEICLIPGGAYRLRRSGVVRLHA